MIYKFFEFNINNLAKILPTDKCVVDDYEILLDVFNTIEDEFSVVVKHSHFESVGRLFVSVGINGDQESIKNLRKSDIFFRIERLTNYRIEDLKQIVSNIHLRGIADTTLGVSDSYISIYYHWMSNPSTPRTSDDVNHKLDIKKNDEK